MSDPMESGWAEGSQPETVVAEKPPRKLNINDPDYDPKLGARLEVKFDGRVQKDTISYDIDAKRIIRYVLGPGGRRVVGNGGRLLIEQKIGNVEVRFKS